MSEPILLLRLEGPLQSWGVRSRWSRRDTGPEPSKSAIIGLLGCAAGILRPDWRSGANPDRTLEEWDMVLTFGVRIDRPGTIETDYHTVQGRFWQADGKVKTKSSKSGARPDRALWEPPHTEVTWRDYLHDASFLVALAIKPERKAENLNLLKRLEGHLKNPVWPIYLGRKSCVPSRPILDRLTDEYPDIETAFRCEPWATRETKNRPGAQPTEKQSQKLQAWIECPDGEYERQDAMRLNRLRFYDFRRCRYVNDIDTSKLRRPTHDPLPLTTDP